MSEDSAGGKKVATSRADISQLHKFEHWPAKRLWPLIVGTVALSAVAAQLPPNYWPWLLVIWPIMGAFIFVFVVAFHDASHDRLHPVHRMNEVFGHIAGTLMFIPLNVYRHAHARHHAYLGTQGDPELWPFNVPGSSRALRIGAAFGEIFLGVVYSPFLFLRSVLLGDLAPGERKLIARGYAACAIVWTAILAITYDLNLWWLLLVTSIVPMAISGFMQTLNKYTQHLGLHGRTVLGLTRTVVDEHPATEVVSSAMFYNDYHGTHHRYAKIPYYNLPSATPYTLANATEFCPVYPNLAYALFAMLPCLIDPRVGPQWLGDSGENKLETPEAAQAEFVGITLGEPVPQQHLAPTGS
jgi:fatty acid desaturase